MLSCDKGLAAPDPGVARGVGGTVVRAPGGAAEFELRLKTNGLELYGTRKSIRQL